MTLQPSLAVLACLLSGCQVSAQLSAGSPDEPETTRASETSQPPPTPTPTPPPATTPSISEPTPVPLPPGPDETATAPSATPPGPSATAPQSPPEVPQRSQVRTSGDRILLPGNVVFASGQSILSPTPENETVLQQLKEFLDENPKVTHVRIEGYTDNVGQPEANVRLSGERALAIKKWLVARGIAAERLIAVGFGADKPIADNASAEGRAQNRRTEFKIAAVNGNPYRGVPLDGGGTEFR